jgi:hypothetical protein
VETKKIDGWEIKFVGKQNIGWVEIKKCWILKNN